jgi:hypothetical protein
MILDYQGFGITVPLVGISTSLFLGNNVRKKTIFLKCILVAT